MIGGPEEKSLERKDNFERLFDLINLKVLLQLERDDLFRRLFRIIDNINDLLRREGSLKSLSEDDKNFLRRIARPTHSVESHARPKATRPIAEKTPDTPEKTESKEKPTEATRPTAEEAPTPEKTAETIGETRTEEKPSGATTLETPTTPEKTAETTENIELLELRLKSVSALLNYKANNYLNKYRENIRKKAVSEMPETETKEYNE